MISLLIPTINRSDFIIKYITYLKNNNFRGEVLIGDSSDEKEFEITKKFIQVINTEFKIKHFEFPEMKHFEVIREMLPYINMPYCMYICDDDILIVKTLEKGISFLEKNPDYSGVGGLAIACEIDPNDYSKILSTRKYQVAEISSSTASQRINELMSNYSVIVYSLARTEQFLERWPIHEKFDEKGIAIELLPCAVLAAQGKVKHLQELFVVRQMHDRRIILPHIFDTIIQPDWSLSINYVIDYLAKLVMKIDSVDYKTALKESKKAWEAYFILWTSTKYNTSKRSNDFERIRKYKSIIKSLPGATNIYIFFRLILLRLRLKSYLALNALLKNYSPFNKDFYPVYQIITANVSTGFK